MKLRLTLLAILSLLLVATVAGAAQISTPADSAQANRAAIFAAPAAPSGANARLPSFAPTPTDKAALACGSCSDTGCVGQQVGTICKVQSGHTYTCQHAYVACTWRDCQCWTGPLP